MRTAPAILVATGLVMGVGSIAGVQAQEVKQPPDIRMMLIQPSNRVAPDSPPAPDLRDLPPAKIDKPSKQPPITVIIGDPHCYPGEEGLTDPRLLRNPRSRR